MNYPSLLAVLDLPDFTYNFTYIKALEVRVSVLYRNFNFSFSLKSLH